MSSDQRALGDCVVYYERRGAIDVVFLSEVVRSLHCVDVHR